MTPPPPPPGIPPRPPGPPSAPEPPTPDPHERTRKFEEILVVALEIADKIEREAFLAAKCGEDAETLLEEVAKREAVQEKLAPRMAAV